LLPQVAELAERQSAYKMHHTKRRGLCGAFRAGPPNAKMTNRTEPGCNICTIS